MHVKLQITDELPQNLAKVYTILSWLKYNFLQFQYSIYSQYKQPSVFSYHNFYEIMPVLVISLLSIG